MTEKWTDRKAPLLVGFGGGLNSSALLVLLYERSIRPDLITFADTGGERPETYHHVERMDAWCSVHGFPPVVVVKRDSPRTGDASLEDACLRLWTLPSRVFGMSSCATKWKIEPQNKYLKSWMKLLSVNTKPWKLLGYDGGEQRRATIFEDELCRYAYPLLEWDVDRDECQRACDRHGLFNIPKSACFFCPSARKPEVIDLAENHPELFARAVAMERQALRPRIPIPGKRAPPLDNVKGLGRHWSWERLWALHLRAPGDATAAQEAARMIENPVESCTMCVDGPSDE